MNPDEDGTVIGLDGYDECWPAGVPPTYCPAGFEKVLDFGNVGLIIYRRLGKSINVSQDKKGSNKSAFKTVIVHNTSDTDVTSEDFLREMQKRDLTCQRCRHIIELALKLLQKVPTINKKSTMGICDHCEVKDPCRNCKEATNSFLNKYEANTNKEKMTKYPNKWENANKDSFLDKKACKQHKISESGLRIEELLRREYAKAERELKISDLCPKKPCSAKSLPVIGQTMQSDRPFLPSSDSEIIVQKDGKNTFTRDDFHIMSDFADIPGKSTYSPSTVRDKQRLKDMASVLYPSQDSPDMKSIRFDDEIIVEPRPVHQHQKSKYYEDDDIFSKHPKQYAHEREKYLKAIQKYTDDKYLDTTEKKKVGVKTKSERKPSDETLKSERYTVLEKSSEPEEIHTILKKDIKKPDLKSKSDERERTQKEFKFLFPGEKIKTENELTQQKTSLELMKELQDQSEENMVEKRSQKEEERERNELERKEKASLVAELDSDANKAQKAIAEIKEMKKDELGVIKEDKLTAGIKSKKQEDQLSNPDRETLKSKKIEPEGKKTNQKEFEKPKVLEIKKTKGIGKNQYTTKNENEKEKASLKEKKRKENSLLTNKQKDKENKKQDDENIWKTEKDFNKKQKGKKEKTDNIVLKGSENKKTQTIKQKQEIVLGDMLTGKNTFKRKDTSQLARMEKPIAKKTANRHLTPIDYKRGKKKDTTNLDIKFKNNKVRPQKNILVKFKEGSIGPRYTYKGKTLRQHWNTHEKSHQVLKNPLCPFCLYSDLELNADLKKQNHDAQTEYIKGAKIVKASEMHDPSDKRMEPILFGKHYEIPIFDLGDYEKKLLAQPENPKAVDEGQNTTTGVTRYALSDRSFIEKGWTVLPTEKVMRKMNVYRMRPAKPEFDWFKRNKDKQMFYDSGERFAEHEDGSCRWYYKNQRLALNYYDAEELNAQQRFVIYSNGEPDERGRARPYTTLATFDHLGNGVVFDHGGKIRLKYNQTEGVVLDRSIGPASQWKWHSLNEPPELQQVMIDTQLSHKDPNILAMGWNLEEQPVLSLDSNNEEMLAIEYDNVVKEKSKKISQNFKPFQIRMKALKINEHFSLKVLDQAHVYLIYRVGTTNIKLNIGMLLDNKEILNTDTVEVGEVACNMERLPARSDSLAAMQKNIAYVQHFETTRTERERRLRLPAPCASADKLTAAISRPLRTPLRTINSSTTTQSTCSMNRKLPSNNVYYSTTC